MTEKKPPLGVTPRFIHDGERRIALLEAIERYARAERPIPVEWVLELMDLEQIKEQNK